MVNDKKQLLNKILSYFLQHKCTPDPTFRAPQFLVSCTPIAVKDYCVTSVAVIFDMFMSKKKLNTRKGADCVVELIWNPLRQFSFYIQGWHLTLNCGFRQPVNMRPCRDQSWCMIKVERRPTHLLLAAVDLPFLLIRQSKHGLSVLICQVQLILQNKYETRYL